MGLLEERMRSPLHLGAMEDADAVGTVGNPACGDVVTFYLRIQEDHIVEASFESIGSAYQLATASVLCDCIQGQSVEGAEQRGPDCVLEKLPDLPGRYRYLAHLAIDGLQRAIAHARQGRRPEDGVVRRHMEPAEAEDFVVHLFSARPEWATLEVEAMAEAEGLMLPGGTARFLSQLKRAGRLDSAMDMPTRSWRWRLHQVASL